MVRTLFALVNFTPDGCVSHFGDGTSWGAQPHDKPHYHALAHRLGYGGDILWYAREHEVAHHLVSEVFGHPSIVIWALAHGIKPHHKAGAAEEALAMVLQRYTRTNEVPLIEHIDWDKLKQELLSMEIRGA